MQSLVEKRLCRLLINPSRSSSSFFLSYTSFNQPFFMLLRYHFDSIVRTSIVNKSVNLKPCYQTLISLSNTSVNKAIVFHRKFVYPNSQMMLHMLKNIKFIHIPTY